jgi:hypothetical protein
MVRCLVFDSRHKQFFCLLLSVLIPCYTHGGLTPGGKVSGALTLITHSPYVVSKSKLWRCTSASLGLTNCVELSATREATSCADTRQFLSILWEPKVHYPVNKNSPLFPVLSHLNIMHPPTSWSTQWSLSL